MQVQNNKIKVLHIIAPVKFGGGESVLLELLKIRDQNYDLNLLCLCKSLEFESLLKENNIKFENLKFSEIAPNSNPFVFLNLLLKLFFTKIILPIDKKYKIIHCHGFPAVIIGFIQSIYRNHMIIYTHHQQVFKSNKISTKIFNLFYNKFDTLTFVSETILNNFKIKFKINKPCKVIYNPVSEIFFKKYVRHINSNKNLKLIYPARFSSQKAHFELITSLIKSKSYNYEIHFYGNGNLKQRCIDLVQKNKLEHVFYFHDLTTQSNLSNLLADFDLAIFPSFYEGFGVAAAECIASNLPVLYNINNETLHEIVADSGWAVSLQNIGDFILNLDANEIHNKANNCSKNANKYKIDSIFLEYRNLYNNLLF